MRSVDDLVEQVMSILPPKRRRKRKTSKIARSETVRVRVIPKVKKALEDTARARHTTPSEIVREMIHKTLYGNIHGD